MLLAFWEHRIQDAEALGVAPTLEPLASGIFKIVPIRSYCLGAVTVKPSANLGVEIAADNEDFRVRSALSASAYPE